MNCASVLTNEAPEKMPVKHWLDVVVRVTGKPTQLARKRSMRSCWWVAVLEDSGLVFSSLDDLGRRPFMCCLLRPPAVEEEDTEESRGAAEAVDEVEAMAAQGRRAGRAAERRMSGSELARASVWKRGKGMGRDAWRG